MGNSWKIGRVAGIDLFLHPTMLFFAVFALWQWGVDESIILAAAFACILLHELGHALTARAFGIPTRDITLTPIGGVARLERMPHSPGAELLITLAGPMVNVGIAAALGLALWVGGFEPWSASGSSYVEGFAFELLVINIVLAVFNMIPAFPMDGGRVLRAVLSGPIGRRRATEIAVFVGRLVATALFVYSLWSWHLMLAILALFVYVAGNSELRAVQADEGYPGDGGGGPDDGTWTAPPGHRWVHRGDGVWQACPIRVESNPYPRRRGPWR